MESQTEQSPLTQLVLSTVRANPGKTAAELRRLINDPMITKSDINRILYKLQKTGEMVISFSDYNGETPAGPPLWTAADATEPTMTEIDSDDGPQE